MGADLLIEMKGKWRKGSVGVRERERRREHFKMVVLFATAKTKRQCGGKKVDVYNTCTTAEEEQQDTNRKVEKT